MNEFHKRLRRLRTEAGYTMGGMAANLKVPISTYREWEYGRTIRNGEMYVRMARILSVSVHYLLTGVSPEKDRVSALLNSISKQFEELKTELISFL